MPGKVPANFELLVPVIRRAQGAPSLHTIEPLHDVALGAVAPGRPKLCEFDEAIRATLLGVEH